MTDRPPTATFHTSRWTLRVGGLLLAAAQAVAQGGRPAPASRAAAVQEAGSRAAVSPSAAARAESLPASAPAPAVDRAEIERATIVGNRELPKVLYIVPWKRPTAPPLAGRMPGSVLDEALQPIDRDVLRRRLQFQQQLRPAADPSPTPDPTLAPGAKR